MENTPSTNVHSTKILTYKSTHSRDQHPKNGTAVGTTPGKETKHSILSPAEALQNHSFEEFSDLNVFTGD